MIRIHKVLDVKGFIFEHPDWNLNNFGMEIKFHLVPDKTFDLPCFNLSDEIFLTHVIVFKRDITQVDIDKWVKGTKLSERGFLCDLEPNGNENLETIKCILIL